MLSCLHREAAGAWCIASVPQCPSEGPQHKLHRATVDITHLDLHCAVEGHMDEQLRVIIIGVQRWQGHVQALRPGPEHSLHAATARLIQRPYLQGDILDVRVWRQACPATVSDLPLRTGLRMKGALQSGVHVWVLGVDSFRGKTDDGAHLADRCAHARTRQGRSLRPRSHGRVRNSPRMLASILARTDALLAAGGFAHHQWPDGLMRHNSPSR